MLAIHQPEKEMLTQGVVALQQALDDFGMIEM
jgi:hypothetical protein